MTTTTPDPDAPSMTAADLVTRARTHIHWYAQHAARARWGYCGIRLAQIVAGACVPFAAALQQTQRGDSWAFLTGSLGVLTVVLEGVQQMYRFHDNWLRYRRSNVALDSELALFLARAGDYASAADAARLFATRMEGLITAETVLWATSLATTDGNRAGPALSATG